MLQPRYHFIYSTVFHFLCKNQIHSYPISIDKLYKPLGIRLVSMCEATISSGLSFSEICSLCGNQDGAVFALPTRNGILHTIIYNSAQPLQRQRFTIAEECAHVLLGHTQNTSFDATSPIYNEDIYQTYEIEARTAAGLLLCSPKVMDLCGNALDPKTLSLACDISTNCAAVRIEQHNRLYAQLASHPDYPLLPAPEITSATARARIHRKLNTEALIRRRARR